MRQSRHGPELQTLQIALTALSSFPAIPLRCMEGTVATIPKYRKGPCACVSPLHVSIDGSQCFVCSISHYNVGSVLYTSLPCRVIRISRLQHDAAIYMQQQYRIMCATGMLRMNTIKNVLLCCIVQDDVHYRTDLVKLALPFMQYLLHLRKYWHSMVL